MRLLNVHDLTLQQFNDNDRPDYAILSHTWGDGEVSFQDIQTPDVAASMAGYSKIVECCEIAKQDGFSYAWIDTCCIDKTSSAELSEAINSMFRWYSDATVCYAFLSDVDDERNHEATESQFRVSRWFTRGWTLQELLAPEVVVFFNSNWIDIGTKHNLQETISEITNIPVEALLYNTDYIQESSIAERMSWAADRKTTRVEDIAYSLMGIFGVNMPPLYGEGIKAFQRLQFEIMRFSKDDSILAWNFPKSRSQPLRVYGPLARSPWYFKDCRGIIHQERPQSTPPFSMTNRGLHIWLPGIRAHYPQGRILLYAELNCAHRQKQKRIFVAFCLRKNSKEWDRDTGRIYDAEDVVAELIRFEPLRKETVDVPMELYLPVRSGFTTGLSRMMKATLDSTFYFNPNQSPETGYCIQYLSILKGSYPTEQLESSIPKNSLNCDTYSLNQSFWPPEPVKLVYCVIKSIQDPGIQTVVALGTLHSGTRKTLHCRIFPGSDVPSSLISLAQFLKADARDDNFSEVFPLEGTMVYPGDKIVEHLPNDDMMITVTIRVGPPFATRSTKSLTNLHVNIAFVSTSSRGE